MPTKQFTLKPSALNATAPIFLKKLFKYSLAAIPIYYVVIWLSLNINYQALLLSLICIVVLASALETKPALIHLHYTTYVFFDTHVLVKSGILSKQRNTMPYNHISRVVNNSSLWDRITNASDITLKSTKHDENQDVTLKSVKNAEEVEHKIYALLKKQDHKADRDSDISA